MITCRRGTTKHLLETHLRHLSEVLDKDWTERDQAEWVQAERLLKGIKYRHSNSAIAENNEEKT